MTQKVSSVEVSGVAALGIVESLLLTLADRKILEKEQIFALLVDAENAYRDAARHSNDAKFHQTVADIICRISVGKDWKSPPSS